MEKGMEEKGRKALFLSSAELQVPLWPLYIQCLIQASHCQIFCLQKKGKEVRRSLFAYTELLSQKSGRAGIEIQLFKQQQKSFWFCFVFFVFLLFISLQKYIFIRVWLRCYMLVQSKESQKSPIPSACGASVSLSARPRTLPLQGPAQHFKEILFFIQLALHQQ